MSKRQSGQKTKFRCLCCLSLAEDEKFQPFIDFDCENSYTVYGTVSGILPGL